MIQTTKVKKIQVIASKKSTDKTHIFRIRRKRKKKPTNKTHSFIIKRRRRKKKKVPYRQRTHTEEIIIPYLSIFYWITQRIITMIAVLNTQHWVNLLVKNQSGFLINQCSKRPYSEV